MHVVKAYEIPDLLSLLVVAGDYPQGSVGMRLAVHAPVRVATCHINDPDPKLRAKAMAVIKLFFEVEDSMRKRTKDKVLLFPTPEASSAMLGRDIGDLKCDTCGKLLPEH